MRVLIDTNVLVDVLLARKPYVATSAEILTLGERGAFSGYVCASAITTLYYLIQKEKGDGLSRKEIQRLLVMYEVAPVTRAVLEGALLLELDDYEDAVLSEAARLAGVDTILTRNTEDFKKSLVRAMTPREMLSALKSGGAESKT